MGPLESGKPGVLSVSKSKAAGEEKQEEKRCFKCL